MKNCMKECNRCDSGFSFWLELNRCFLDVSLSHVIPVTVYHLRQCSTAISELDNICFLCVLCAVGHLQQRKIGLVISSLRSFVVTLEGRLGQRWRGRDRFPILPTSPCSFLWAVCPVTLNSSGSKSPSDFTLREGVSLDFPKTDCGKTHMYVCLNISSVDDKSREMSDWCCTFIICMSVCWVCWGKSP